MGQWGAMNADRMTAKRGEYKGWGAGESCES